MDAAERELAKVRQLYESSLQAKEPSEELQTTIKHVVEDQRSSLDHVATAINEKFGTKGKQVYFPYAHDPGKFQGFFDQNFPKLATFQPDICAAMERHQPYQPGHEWLAHLVSLTNENKHRDLTPQTKTETVVKAVTKGSGSVSWGSGVTFGPGVSIMGEPVDPATQKTASTVVTIYIDWLFADPPVSALQTLETIQKGIRPMLEEVCIAAGL